ncbi:MAG TPA: hypothetical protein V6C65_19295, partial [Allocoleopsis sp.]
MNQRPSINDILSGEPIPGRLLLSRARFRFGSVKQNSLHQTIFTNCLNSRPLSYPSPVLIWPNIQNTIGFFIKI